MQSEHYVSRSSLEQVTQYLNKNIPDADSWLKTTEGAVDEAVSVITDLYAYCEQGATDSYSHFRKKYIGREP